MARVTKRTKAKELEPYWYNPYISISYEIDHKDGLIQPGTLLKFKNSSKLWKFRCQVSNALTGVIWIDVLSAEGYGWSSFDPKFLKGIHIAKRSRAKKKVSA